MKSESLIEVLTTATEALRAMTPLLEGKPAEFERFAPVLAALRLEVRRVTRGEFSPAQYRAMHPWQPEAVKADLRSPELLALDAEVAQLDSEYQTARLLWEKCVTEQINRRAPLVVTSMGQIVPNIDAKEAMEMDERIETAAHLRDQASDVLQAKRAQYYSLLRAEQAHRRAAAYREQQAAEMEAKQQAAERRKQSFAAAALEFFGIKA